MKPFDIISHMSSLILLLLYSFALILDFITIKVVNFIIKRFFSGKKEYTGYAFELFTKISVKYLENTTFNKRSSIFLQQNSLVVIKKKKKIC